MINLVDVSHHFSIRPILRHVNLHVATGEVLALMGPNGSGKSTLLSIMAGVTAPWKGHVEIDGKRRRSDPEAELAIRRKVVYLPAETWLPLMITVREWLLAVGRVYGIDDDRLFDHVERLLALFELHEKADSRASLCSTGQKRKVALAGALVTEAPVMLLDEPFSGGLDPTGIHALRRVLGELAKRDDVTIVMATPVPELVEQLADRAAILRNGQLVACDTIAGLQSATATSSLQDAYEKLVHPETAGGIEQYFQGARP